MVMEHIDMRTVLLMLANGSKINSMDTVLNLGQMVLAMMANIKMEKKTVKDF